MRKNISLILTTNIIAILTLLSSCTTPKNESADIAAVVFQTPESVQSETTTYVSDTDSANGVELIIDADVEVGDLSKLVEVTLTVDEDNLNNLVNDLVKSKYPKAGEDTSKEPGVHNWSYWENGNPLVNFIADDFGNVSYLDYPNDRNGTIYDGEHLMEYGYITDVVPSQLDLSATEAANLAGEYFKQYSYFTYRPWNIMAADSDKDLSEPGYYHILLQAVFNGIPISTKFETNTVGIGLQSIVSDIGVFQFVGTFLLKPAETKIVEKIVPFEAIISKFKADYSFFASGETVETNKIIFEYFPISNEDGTYTLRPVWSFYCIDTRTELERWETDLNEVITKYTTIYFADDGSFCGLYY